MASFLQQLSKSGNTPEAQKVTNVALLKFCLWKNSAFYYGAEPGRICAITSVKRCVSCDDTPAEMSASCVTMAPIGGD